MEQSKDKAIAFLVEHSSLELGITMDGMNSPAAGSVNCSQAQSLLLLVHCYQQEEEEQLH